MKATYKFNAKKYITTAMEAGVDPDIIWASLSNGKEFEVNETIGIGVLDGKIIPTKACDKSHQSFLNEPATELEEKLFEQCQECADVLREMRDDVIALDERLQAEEEENERLLKAHCNLLDLVEEYNDYLPKGFIEKLFAKVASEVMGAISDSEDEDDCDGDCGNCCCL